MKRILDVPAAVAAAGDSSFSAAVIGWQKKHGRHALPWQGTRDPYRIWLSEIMLQQTQVAAVIPYYLRFLGRFPDVGALADATQEEVMEYWSGLGYYSRARNLHRCAQQVVAQHGGVFPRDPALLAALPGIGASTAAAVAAFSYGVRAAILDGNVKRVFCRVFGIEGFPGTKAVENMLWERAHGLLPAHDIEAYTQGLMDLGATICTRSRPHCSRCPLAARCNALATERVHLLPTPRPTKAVPLRQTGMLVVEDRGAILLERRPQQGIWGGLLSLPEFAAGDQALGAAAPFGAVRSTEALPPFTHAFTHFRLHVSPWRAVLDERARFAGEERYLWQPVSGLSEAALPAPVKKLLLHLYPPSRG